jgi:hypothetical protein
LSAYIVDHDHIDALLSYGIQHQVRYVAPESGSCVEIDLNNATEIGRILLDENERSVRHRYPGSHVDDLPGTIGQNSACYKFRRWPAPGDAMAMLKACDGYDYQACETDDYEQSLAATIIRAIRGFAIRRLPGFSESPGWHMHRPVRKSAA